MLNIFNPHDGASNELVQRPSITIQIIKKQIDKQDKTTYETVNVKVQCKQVLLNNGTA
jgi:hypothetical protein